MRSMRTDLRLVAVPEDCPHATRGGCTRGFRHAVDQLQPNLRETLVKYVFNPDSCRAIKLPEQ